MQTTVKRRTARKAFAAGIAAAAATGATVFTVQHASAEEHPATAQTCAREALPIPEGLVSTSISGMSDDGSVIAYYALPLDETGPDGLGAFPRLYADGEVTDVPMPGDHPRIRDVNSSGNGTGYSTGDNGRDVPYIWSDGALAELPVNERGGQAEGINEGGDIVGSGASSEGGVPLLWPADGSGPVELPLPDSAVSGYAHDIGDDGTIIGAVYNENGTPTAYTWGADGSGEPLPAPPGADPATSWSIAVDINGDWVSGTYYIRGQESPATGTRWNLAEGTAEQTQLDDQVAVSAGGTVAGFVPGTPNIAAYQEGDTVVELPGVIPPEDRTMSEYAQEISADGTLIAGDVYMGRDESGAAIFNAVVWTCE